MQSQLSEHDRTFYHYLGDYLKIWATDALNDREKDRLEKIALAMGDDLAQGHSCIDMALRHRQDDWPAPGELADLLTRAGLLCTPAKAAPLTIENDLLYLTRYHRYETSLTDKLRQLAGHKAAISRLNRDEIKTRLEKLFPNDLSQRRAAAGALLQSVAIITGGPGVGKTTLLCRLLALLTEQQDIRVLLAAPTGKAAARLSESMRLGLDRLKAEGLAEEAAAKLPAQAVTMHRLLGFRPIDNTFYYGADNRLPADVVVVDEASMVDLKMMAQLTGAIGEQCRLILSGDHNQLVSVETGCILKDLCESQPAQIAAGFSEQHLTELKTLLTEEALQGITQETASVGLADTICQLQTNHRSSASIHRLATAVIAGDEQETLAALRGDNIFWEEEIDLTKLIQLAVDYYRPLCGRARSPTAKDEVADLLKTFESFRILSNYRQGRLGSVQLNLGIEKGLREQGLVTDSAFYAGRLVMATTNNYDLGIFNGDVGLALADGNIYFADQDGLKSVSGTELTGCESAFALSVHKSQGSEFNTTVLLLSGQADQPSLLNRELLYTAITRTREKLHVFAESEVIKQSVRQPTHRRSGLRQKLWG